MDSIGDLRQRSIRNPNGILNVVRYLVLNARPSFEIRDVVQNIQEFTHPKQASIIGHENTTSRLDLQFTIYDYTIITAYKYIQ